MADIKLEDLTNATTVSDGTGVLDVLMKTINLHVVKQFDMGRITGPEYATVYVGALQSAISESIKFLLGEQAAGLQADLLEEKIESERKNNGTDGSIDKKDALVDAQALGFKLDAKQKLLKSMLDGFAVNASVSGTLGNVPETTLDGSIDQLSQEILSDLNSLVTIQTVPETAEIEA